MLTKDQVKHVAKLAQLSLTEKEIGKFRQQLSAILDYFKQLNKLDTSRVKATSQVTGLENVYREDKPAPSLTQKEALAGAKAKQSGHFKTKPILNQS